MKSIDFIIQSDSKNISIVAAALKGICQYLKIAQNDIGPIIIGCVECLNNCVQHAYQYELNREIKIKLKIDNSIIIIEVINYGKPIGEPIIPDSYDLERESGRGLFIINSCFEHVIYKSENGVNTVTLSRKVTIS